MTLTNYDIDKIENVIKLPTFRGCFSKDELPHVKKANECMIINMQDDKDGDGSHWICLYKHERNGTFYFDSFGLEPPIDIISYCKNKYHLVTDKQIQPIKSNKCGWYCLYVLDMLTCGEFLHNNMSTFSTTDLNKNDELIKRYFREYNLKVK